MKDIWTIIQWVFASLGCLLGYIFGNLDGFLIALIVFVIADYITGLCSAFIRKKVSSKVGFKGIIKKICIFIVVAIANIIDVNLLEIPMLRTAVIFFYISNEGISIVENLTILGVPVPKKLKDVLTQIKEKGDKNEF